MAASQKRWKRISLPGNHEKPVEGWQLGKYTVCLNLNKGRDVKTGVEDKHGHFWWYEITETINGHGQERAVGEAPTEDEAKKIVKKILRNCPAEE